MALLSTVLFFVVMLHSLQYIFMFLVFQHALLHLHILLFNMMVIYTNVPKNTPNTGNYFMHNLSRYVSFDLASGSTRNPPKRSVSMFVD